jgi:Na+-translocating ferredoxin:NAD+ oxidoreductase RnfC subunit
VIKEGQMIGKIPDGELGANIHASISGKVKEVTKEFVSIES